MSYLLLCERCVFASIGKFFGFLGGENLDIDSTFVRLRFVAVLL